MLTASLRRSQLSWPGKRAARRAADRRRDEVVESPSSCVSGVRKQMSPSASLSGVKHWSSSRRAGAPRTSRCGLDDRVHTRGDGIRIRRRRGRGTLADLRDEAYMPAPVRRPWSGRAGSLTCGTRPLAHGADESRARRPRLCGPDCCPRRLAEASCPGGRAGRGPRTVQVPGSRSMRMARGTWRPPSPRCSRR